MGGRLGPSDRSRGVAGRSDSKNKIDVGKCMTFLVTNSGPDKVALATPTEDGRRVPAIADTPAWV